MNWTTITPAFSNTAVSFTRRLNGTDIGLNQFMFNTTDTQGFTDNTTEKQNLSDRNITLTVDPVSLSIQPGTDSEVRRRGSNTALFNFSVFDEARNTYAGNVSGRVWVTENHTDFTVSLQDETEEAFIDVLYNPGCGSDVGEQQWIGGTVDPWYEKQNLSSTNVTVIGQLNVTVRHPDQNDLLNRNSTYWLNATVTSDCQSEGFIENATVEWFDDQNDQIATGYNTTWQVDQNQPLGNDITEAAASKQYYDFDTDAQPVQIFGYANLSRIRPLNGTVLNAGTEQPVTCGVQELNTGDPVQDYLVKFWKNDSQGNIEQIGVNASGVIGADTTNANGNATVDWSVQDSAGTYDIFCNITENAERHYNVSTARINTTIQIRRPLRITEINPRPDQVFRNDSFTPHLTNVTVETFDASIGPEPGANVTFWNATNNRTRVGFCTTNSNGNCNLTNHNFSDTITPGRYTLYINATAPCCSPSTTNQTDIVVQGVIFNEIIEPDHLQPIQKGDTVSLENNITSDNNKTVPSPSDALVSWYNETGARIAFWTADGSSHTLSSSVTASQSTGLKNWTSNATKQFWKTGHDEVRVRINGRSGAGISSPVDGTVIPYPDNFTVVGNVTDLASGDGISDYRFNISYRWEGQASYTQIASLMTGPDGENSIEFDPDRKDNITFRVEIGDNLTQFYQASRSTYTATYWVKDVQAPQFNQTTAIPNRSLEANRNHTRITANVTDNYGIKSVVAEITRPDDTTTIVPMQNITPVQPWGEGGEQAVYAANFTPTVGGNFTVDVIATDENPENNWNRTFVSYLEVFGTTAGRVNLTPISEVATGITLEDNYTYTAVANFTNTGPATAYGVNMTHEGDLSLINGTTVSFRYNDTERNCGRVPSNKSCVWTFQVTVPEKAAPQVIDNIVNVTWENAEGGEKFTRNATSVSIASNPQPRIEADIVNGSHVEGDNRRIVNGTVEDGSTNYKMAEVLEIAYGNDDIEDIRATFQGGNFFTDCPDCNLTVFPNSTGVLSPGSSIRGDVVVDVPKFKQPGYYWTKIRMTTSNAGFDDILFNMTVPFEATWTREPASFGTLKVQPGTSGFVGNVTTENTGNVKLPLKILQSGNGSTFVEAYPFGAQGADAYELAPGEERNVSVAYSIPADINGTYRVEIIQQNVTIGEPPSRSTVFRLNITDRGPNISRVQVEPREFEVFFGQSNISARITDNFPVDQAWINISVPVANQSWKNATYVDMMNNTAGQWYNATYNTTVPGQHNLTICANSTNPNTGITQQSCTATIPLEAAGESEVKAFTGEIIADNVTIIAQQRINETVFINNTGAARVNATNLSISTSGNTSTNETFFQIGRMMGRTSERRKVTVFVDKGLEPGTYRINLSTEWINLLDTRGTNLARVNVTVIENRLLTAETTPAITVNPGGNNTGTFRVNATGNMPINNASIVCESGTVCSNFTVSFEPQGFNLSVAREQRVNFTVEVPDRTRTGEYNGTLQFLENQSIPIGESEIEVFVAKNISWQQSPDNLTVIGLSGRPREMGTVTVRNTGNVFTELEAFIQGNISTHADLSRTYLELPFEDTNTTNVSVRIPRTEDHTYFAGDVLTSNDSVALERATKLNLIAIPYFVDITHPTQQQKQTGVGVGSNLSTLVNVTFGANASSSPIQENVTFQARFVNETTVFPVKVVNTTFNATTGLW
ncbi:MAG: hypothetical protein SVU32_07785, partial [Candidatus Nanohaloarchaea archaeon]|nr:hypothetical protein [Candidatus Nanohaloarchaea archaeon]